MSSSERLIAKDAATGFWNALTGIQFTGFQPCNGTAPDAVHLATSDAGVHVQDMGVLAIGTTVTVGSMARLSTEDFMTEVLHELGHVIGLAHTSSASCGAGETAAGIANDLPAIVPSGRTVNSSDSIMSVCSSSGPDVTQADIDAVQRLYGITFTGDSSLDSDGDQF